MLGSSLARAWPCERRSAPASSRGGLVQPFAQRDSSGRRRGWSSSTGTRIPNGRELRSRHFAQQMPKTKSGLDAGREFPGWDRCRYRPLRVSRCDALSCDPTTRAALRLRGVPRRPRCNASVESRVRRMRTSAETTIPAWLPIGSIETPKSRTADHRWHVHERRLAGAPDRAPPCPRRSRTDTVHRLRVRLSTRVRLLRSGDKRLATAPRRRDDPHRYWDAPSTKWPHKSLDGAPASQ